MDVVLEVTDTFLWDYMYAWALPAPQTSLGLGLGLPNSTTIGNGWEYKPSTAFFSLQPSQAAYQSSLPRDNAYRQGFSLFLIIWLFGLLVYFVFASLSYFFVFDKANMSHPKFLKNQIWLEMVQANQAFPVMSILTVPIALAEVRGYSKLYDTTEEGPGYWYNFAQVPLFLIFTDFCIYWIHRGLHHPYVYKWLHKPHHKWIMPTPFASHAFHPLDGYAQGFPYHVFVFIFPLQKMAYVALFVFVNFWTILIHDGEYYADNAVINGAACHAVHHFAFNYNYGQYTTLWDRIGGSYRRPDAELFDKATKTSNAQWEKQKTEMERMVKVVEGKDDRTYDPVGKKTQ
ncbi:C-5 sterol desaturase [Magnaporthiopsis poae ATCC 64411]|uniref:C-5 sterol desaturase n=1 Tax=Magnaporthiopsis poae (strain ATCC 64411 / 73-15) TaxID=644358 RepID=A0A0C4E758_MAGP6|nr:C-5 sterol desaturase [Magnaporthiopsis poae ATCC 64411]